MDMIPFPVSRPALSLLVLGALLPFAGGCRGTLELTPSDAATVLADQAIPRFLRAGGSMFREPNALGGFLAIVSVVMVPVVDYQDQ